MSAPPSRVTEAVDFVRSELRTLQTHPVTQSELNDSKLRLVSDALIDEASADGFVGTDEASLAERSGHEVAVVMGSPKNIKITTPGDMELAEFYLKK